MTHGSQRSVRFNFVLILKNFSKLSVRNRFPLFEKTATERLIARTRLSGPAAMVESGGSNDEVGPAKPLNVDKVETGIVCVVVASLGSDIDPPGSGISFAGASS